MWQDRAACGDFNNNFKMFIAISDHNHFNEQKHLVVVCSLKKRFWAKWGQKLKMYIVHNVICIESGFRQLTPHLVYSYSLKMHVHLQ